MTPREKRLFDTFRLEDGKLIRIRTGKEVILKPYDYTRVKVGREEGSSILEYAHRIIFFLSNGHLPTEVDHRDQDKANQEPDNLREADRSLQMHNRKYQRTLPRGVSQRRPGGRYSAKVEYRRKVHLLGTYDTPEAASVVVEEKLREIYGPRYSPAVTA